MRQKLLGIVRHSPRWEVIKSGRGFGDSIIEFAKDDGWKRRFTVHLFYYLEAARAVRFRLSIVDARTAGNAEFSFHQSEIKDLVPLILAGFAGDKDAISALDEHADKSSWGGSDHAYWWSKVGQEMMERQRATRQSKD